MQEALYIIYTVLLTKSGHEKWKIFSLFASNSKKLNEKPDRYGRAFVQCLSLLIEIPLNHVLFKDLDSSFTLWFDHREAVLTEIAVGQIVIAIVYRPLIGSQLQLIRTRNRKYFEQINR